MTGLTVRDAVRLTLVVLAFVVVQQTVVLDIRIDGVHPDVMVLLPIVAGIAGGPSQGAWMGFAAGVVADLFLPTPFGLSALVGTVVGFSAGYASLPFDETAVWLAPLFALVGSAAYEGAYAVLGSVLGQPQMVHADLTLIILLVAGVNVVLALPARRIVAWALPEPASDRMAGHLTSPGMIR